MIFIRLLSAFFGLFFRRDAQAYVERKAEEHSEDLSVHESVVDLLKSLNQPSSMEARKALSIRFGHMTYSGTAAENIWLHGEIMRGVALRRFP